MSARLSRLITKYKLGRYREQLLALEGPGLELVTKPAPRLPAGATKLGGMPDVPRGFRWPRANGKSLSFIGQVNVADIPREFGWPTRHGLLAFFYDVVRQPWGYSPKDRAGFKIVHFPGTASKLRPIPKPDGAGKGPGEGGLLPQLRARLRKAPCIPPLENPALARFLFSPHQRVAYGSLYDEFLGVQKRPRHQILGWPTVIQSDMEEECQLASHGIDVGGVDGVMSLPALWLRSGAARWMLLLQVKSDDDLGIMFGDMGMIYFYATAESIASGRLDETWCVLQCS